MAEATEPTGGSRLARRQLGRTLRALREGAHLTREDVATTKMMSRSKLEYIEHGHRPVTQADVTELATFYRVPSDVIGPLREMAAATRQKGFWQEYSNSFRKGFDTFLDLESVAVESRILEPGVIHGLLQTPDYAAAIQSSTAWTEEDQLAANGRVQVRLKRQRRLLDPRCLLQVRAVLGEAALRLRVGDESIMSEQYRHLISLAELENVSISILPFAAGPHPGVRGGFDLLSFKDPMDPPTACVDGHMSIRYTADSALVAKYQEIHDAALARSVPIKEFVP